MLNMRHLTATRANDQENMGDVLIIPWPRPLGTMDAHVPGVHELPGAY